MSIPFTEVYRPKLLDDVIGQERNITIFKNFIKEQTFPHLIMYGSKGCGKTSSILAFAREFYNNDNDNVLLVNASMYNNIRDIRKKIGTFLKTSSNIIKLVILDESDCLTKDAMYILREMMDTYTTSRICFICNYPNNILDIIRSRSFIMFFPPIPHAYILQRLQLINDNNQLLEKITSNCNGDMRKALIDLEFNQNCVINYKILVERYLNIIYNDFDNLDTIVMEILNNSCNIINFYEELNEQLMLEYANDINNISTSDCNIGLGLMYIGYQINYCHRIINGPNI